MNTTRQTDRNLSNYSSTNVERTATLLAGLESNLPLDTLLASFLADPATTVRGKQ